MTFAAVVTISQDTRVREIENVFVGPAALRRAGFFEAAETGDWQAAAEALASAYIASYGLPSSATIDELLTLDIEIGRQGGEPGGRTVR